MRSVAADTVAAAVFGRPHAARVSHSSSSIYRLRLAVLKPHAKFEVRGVVGRGRGGTASPHFFRQGGRVPHFPTSLD